MEPTRPDDERGIDPWMNPPTTVTTASSTSSSSPPPPPPPPVTTPRTPTSSVGNLFAGLQLSVDQGRDTATTKTTGITTHDNHAIKRDGTSNNNNNDDDTNIHHTPKIMNTSGSRLLDMSGISARTHSQDDDDVTNDNVRQPHIGNDQDGSNPFNNEDECGDDENPPSLTMRRSEDSERLPPPPPVLGGGGDTTKEPMLSDPNSLGITPDDTSNLDEEHIPPDPLLGHMGLDSPTTFQELPPITTTTTTKKDTSVDLEEEEKEEDVVMEMAVNESVATSKITNEESSNQAQSRDDTVATAALVPVATSSVSSYGGFFSGWFGTTTVVNAAPPPISVIDECTNNESKITNRSIETDETLYADDKDKTKVEEETAREQDPSMNIQKEESISDDTNAIFRGALGQTTEDSTVESPLPRDNSLEFPEDEARITVATTMDEIVVPSTDIDDVDPQLSLSSSPPPPEHQVGRPPSRDPPSTLMEEPNLSHSVESEQRTEQEPCKEQDQQRSPQDPPSTHLEETRTVSIESSQETGPPAIALDETVVEEPSTPRKYIREEDKQALDEAFNSSDYTPAPVSSQPSQSIVTTSLRTPNVTPAVPALRGIQDQTAIPNADVALRLLRKFAHKTRPRIITTYGGTKSRSIITFFFGSGKEDPTFTPYRALIDVLFQDGDTDLGSDESDRIVDAVMGVDGDTMAKARQAIVAFANMFSIWGHASSRYFEQKNVKGQQEFSELMSASFDTASELAAHGCLDGVCLSIRGRGGDEEVTRVVDLLAQSVFNADLSIERNELTAMKFLLGTGCRVDETGDALLHGSHLLQTIRIFYHIYLTTLSRPNKTTARAALQQLTTSIFTRVVRTDTDERFQKTSDNFPSPNHRDAFLVLRSICKLSMRSIPDSDYGGQSHFGLQASGSYETWDERQDQSSRGMIVASDEGAVHSPRQEHAELLYTNAIHPAMESKVLALELLLYVLQNTKFPVLFVKRSGHQFHAAIRNYLCVSLLKNCMSDNTNIVNLSLRIFVPLVRNFRSVLKSEIEAFVTNVFFVILDSKNSPAEHRILVVKTFDEICSDPPTLAEIFLNYDCDLSAVDLFHRIVNTLSMVSRTGIHEPRSTSIFLGSQSVARMEKTRSENRELRLVAMKALRQVLASLHSSILQPVSCRQESDVGDGKAEPYQAVTEDSSTDETPHGESGKQSLVEIYDSKKKRRAEEAEIALRFNQKPSAGIAYAAKCGHLDGEDPVDVARYLLANKDKFDKTQIGEYLGREAEYQNGFSIKVLHEYVRMMDFSGLVFDDAIRYFLSGFRLPGEAQKIDRIMEKFAERFTEQNPDVFPTADVAFILAFSIIMLNTDLHNPAIKEERRMTKEGFIRNNRGICDGNDLPEELLLSIFDRIKSNPISLKEDDEARERIGESKRNRGDNVPTGVNPSSLFSNQYDDLDRARESNFQKERDHIVRTTESLLKRRRPAQVEAGKSFHKKSPAGKAPRQAPRFVMAEDSGLRDEYVSPMFEVTWGPALAAFSTAMESANGTVGSLIAIASDEELELAAENAAETIEVCLTGFRFAICTAGLCGNETARDAYMLALAGFSQLGTGVLLEPRHIRCIQTMLGLAREDGEILGNSWQHIFKALSEINRFHQLFHLMARNDRVAAAAAQRRQRRLEAKDMKRKERARRRIAAEDGESINADVSEESGYSDTDDSLAESDLFDDDYFIMDEEMDSRARDEANARAVYDAVSETSIEGIYERSISLTSNSVKDFVRILCRVSAAEISVGSNRKRFSQSDNGRGDLNAVPYREQHVLLNHSSSSGDQFHHSQPNIYNLQKLVEVTHYNMESRPRLVFSDLWTIVAEHLTNTALHDNPAIAMYAVDSFRQLSIQYLQRDELEVFEFQKRFLKPLETVMAQSHQSSTKELLLNCVAYLLQFFGQNPRESENVKGGLKSGWVPLLAILGMGGKDTDVSIASLSSGILFDVTASSMNDERTRSVLLSEHFVEAVNALLAVVDGPYIQISQAAVERLYDLAEYLADSSIESPHVKRRVGPKQDIELWWPILLGLSKAVGDARVDLRSKALDTLGKIIDKFFFPNEMGVSCVAEDADEHMQTLQLIFRGILTPILENAETDAANGEALIPSLPDDFDKLFSSEKSTKAAVEHTLFMSDQWLETTFDVFLDMCIRICLRSIDMFKDACLIDEVFAILNNCLVSDSGSIAVRGLRRLEQFVSIELDLQFHNDDVWATVSHLLRRCLTVRSLPVCIGTSQLGDSDRSEDSNELSERYKSSAEDFVAEDAFLISRRYIGSNATMIAANLLLNDRFPITLRWRLFLIAGLGRGIEEWEQAAIIVQEFSKVKRDDSFSRPPDYEENALYGRKWMNRLLLQLATNKEIIQAPTTLDPKLNRNAAGQKLLLDETRRLLEKYLIVERAAGEYRAKRECVLLLPRMTSLVQELLSGYLVMGGEYLKDMAWLNPVLLDSCIQCKNDDIRSIVQKLVQETTGSTNVSPYPSPMQTVAGVSESIIDHLTLDCDATDGERKEMQSNEEIVSSSEGMIEPAIVSCGNEVVANIDTDATIRELGLGSTHDDPSNITSEESNS